MNSWDAFRTGLARVVRYRWVWLVLFAVNVASALLLAALPALGLAAGFGHRPAIRQAADGVDAWLVIETLFSPLADGMLGQGVSTPTLPAQGDGQVAGLVLITAAALPLLAWLPAAFVSGGALLTYAEAPQHFGWRRFWWGCWHWFVAFLLLGMGQFVAAVALFLPALAAAIAAIAAAGWLAWIAVPGLALAAMLWTAATEITRVIAVASGTRNIFRAFSGAVGFIVRHLPAVAGLYGLTLLALGLVHVLFRWGLMARLPLGWWLLVLLVQQAFVLARLGIRLVRMAGGVALVAPGTGAQSSNSTRPRDGGLRAARMKARSSNSATECGSGTGGCDHPGALRTSPKVERPRRTVRRP